MNSGMLARSAGPYGSGRIAHDLLMVPALVQTATARWLGPLNRLPLCPVRQKTVPSRIAARERAPGMAIVEAKTVTLDKIAALAKRRGFVYGSAEIYGGL